MTRTYLEFELVDGGAAILREVFDRNRILETSVAQPGCLAAELTIADDTRTAIVTALWVEPAAYAAWTSRADRGSLGDELQPALRSPISEATVGRVFTVAEQRHCDEL